MLLSFNVEKQIITRTDTEKVVTNSMNYLYAQFTFTDEWVGEKTAVFKGKHGTYNALLDAENKCLVPWEILTEAMFDVSVFCGDLITANAVKIFTIPSGYEIGDESRIPTPDIYQQVINRLNEIEAEIDPEAIEQIVQEYVSSQGYVTQTDVETIVADYVEEHKDELKGDTGETGPQGPAGVGVPTGGTTGQVLVKKSNSNYDTEWKDASGGSSTSNVLYGKKWCACGDSFTAGDFTGYVDPEGHSGTESDAYDPEMEMYKTYPWWIAKRNNMDLVMLAKNGQDFTNVTGALSAFSKPNHYGQIPSDADYVTLWFGLNEYNLTTEQIGAKGDTTNKTLWGAYHVVFNSILTNNPLAKIGVFITDGGLFGGIPQAYHDALIDICKYWAIPYLDLRNGLNVPMGLGGRLDDCSDVSRLKRKEAFQVSASNIHPNVNAHEYRSIFIENFLRSL